MREPKIYLEGIGTAVPPFSIQQQDAARAAIKFCDSKESRLVEALYGFTRIEKRGSVILEKNCEGEEPAQDFYPVRQTKDDHGPSTKLRMAYYQKKAPPLALEASRLALKHAKVQPEQIKQLVSVSCTGFFSPGVDIYLMKQLGFSNETGRTHIGFMGCHAMFNAFRAGAAYASLYQKVLLSSVELCSLHFSYDERYDHMLSNALFSDGASSAVLSSNPSNHAWQLAKNGSCVFPESENLMQWHIGNHGFSMVLSDKIPHLLAKNLKPWLIQWLAESNLNLSSIRSWAVHPGGPRILNQIESCLELPASSLEISRHILTQFGNMSSATILFILDALQRQKAATPCVALAFGPGLTAEAALFL